MKVIFFMMLSCWVASAGSVRLQQVQRGSAHDPSRRHHFLFFARNSHYLAAATQAQASSHQALNQAQEF
jgi:hypothetical protein